MSQKNQNVAAGPDSFKRDQVVSIINSVIGKVRGPQDFSRYDVCKELGALKEIIEGLRRQLHAAQPTDISQMHIPSATDELDAIVGTTEQATVTILEASEAILTMMEGQNPELAQKVEAQVVRVYEACTFQDITGQRITKVVKTLKKIDEKVTYLLKTLEGQLVNLGEAAASARGPEEEKPEKNGDPPMHGPALPQNAVSQEDIDKILAEFGN